MLVEFPSSDRKYGFVVSTGYKAGLILVMLPQEAELEHSSGVSRQWVIDNWNKWIYETCSVDDVYVDKNYPVPASLIWCRQLIKNEFGYNARHYATEDYHGKKKSKDVMNLLKYYK